VLAETYLVAWTNLDVMPQGAQSRLWLFGVARTLMIKGGSGSRTRSILVERLADGLRGANLPRGAFDDERAVGLGSALAKLPERDLEILRLTSWEDLSPREIAAVLGISVNVVRVRLHRARSRLKRDLTTPAPSCSRANTHVRGEHQVAETARSDQCLTPSVTNRERTRQAAGNSPTCSVGAPTGRSNQPRRGAPMGRSPV
jgi:RNA polymerase sigma factor (sigma-70 family)